MNALDPAALISRITKDIPAHLRAHLYVTGSLAAAYEYKQKLRGQAINTKDADLVIHPAGHTTSCREIAIELLALRWRPTEDCYPQVADSPANELRAIRLLPPTSDEYFLELLNVPATDQVESLKWIPVRLEDGWYGLPSFRFMGLTALHRLRSDAGLEYASPAMMTLSNLLSHRALGTDRISKGELAGVLRSAKDLGRVLSLAQLAGRNITDGWGSTWIAAMKETFPDTWTEIVRNAGAGMRELLNDAAALEEARQTVDIGLLSGMAISTDQLAAIGERLLADAIDPLESSAGG
jgi:hypothetical protein